MALLKSEAGKSQISTCDTQKINKRLILQFIFQGFMHFSAVLDDSTGWSRCVGFFYFGSTWNTEERISCFFKSDLKRSSKKNKKKNPSLTKQLSGRNQLRLVSRQDPSKLKRGIRCAVCC